MNIQIENISEEVSIEIKGQSLLMRAKNSLEDLNSHLGRAKKIMN
jgi:hypothetical protein